MSPAFERGPVESCAHCGDPDKVMPKALAALMGQALPNTFVSLTGQAFACIEDPVVIKKILSHRLG